MGRNAIREAREELRRPGPRLVGSVAYFPEGYGQRFRLQDLEGLQPLPSGVLSLVRLVAEK